MKNIILPIVLLLATCSTRQNPSGIGGTYTAFFEHEYGRNFDTLVLDKVNDGEDVYQASRRTGLIKKLKGKEFPKELSTETWILIYDSEQKIFREQKEGKIILWDQDKGTIQLGHRTYKKLP